MSVRLDYDVDADALYITLSDTNVARTVEVDDETMVDLDAAGGLVGIEVISYNRPWPLGQILSDYEVHEADAAQLRALFRPSERRVEQTAPASVAA